MNINQIAELAAELISFQSVSGEEAALGHHFQQLFEARNWSVEMLPVDNERRNVYVRFGEPKIVLCTHYDVVPAPAKMFQPRIEDGVLYGRGACDTKGIIAALIATVESLANDQFSDFGLLLLVGEERSGEGAYAAAKQLRNQGIRFIVNGEPTDRKIVTAHKGALSFDAMFTGAACHSGYPELGEDANAKLLDALSELRALDYGHDPELGDGSVNIGKIDAGHAGNIVSPCAQVKGIIRTVRDSNDSLLEQVKHCFRHAASVELEDGGPPARLMRIPGFDTTTAGFFTDIPRLAELSAEAVLFGPGTIHVAHTDDEQISLDELAASIDDYQRIVHYLQQQL